MGQGTDIDVEVNVDAARLSGQTSRPSVHLDEVKAGPRGLQWLLYALLPVLLVVYAKPLISLIRFAANSDLYSHILIIPAIAAYFAWQKRKLLVFPSRPAWLPASLCVAFSVGVFAAFQMLRQGGFHFTVDDSLAMWSLTFVAFLWSAALLYLGSSNCRKLLFPGVILLFMVPFPTVLLGGIETALQHGSALMADFMFWVSGTAYIRESTYFQLPGMRLHVAPECSGIHSSLVLLITSIIAGQVFLKSTWRRLVLALIVVPLALLRNGFRIFVIGQLCVNIGPEMIDSPIHRRGGPIFFVLSLIPFFLLLLWFLKAEGRWRKPLKKSAEATESISAV